MKIDMNWLYSSLSLLSLIGCASSHQCDTHSSPDAILSFHQGYSIWEEQLEHPDMPYDLEQVILGMRSAAKGDAPILADEALHLLIHEFQEQLFDKQAQRNLKEAERFLHSIDLNPLALELVPKKLYYIQSRQGEEKRVEIDDMPLITYTASVLKNGVVTEIFSPGPDPIPLSIADTIPGFI